MKNPKMQALDLWMERLINMRNGMNDISEFFIKLHEFLEELVNHEVAEMSDEEIKAIKEKYGNIKNGEL